VFAAEYWIRGLGLYRYEDEIPLYVEHIRTGVAMAEEDPHALIVFSGGFTVAPEAFPEGSIHSEAAGYLAIAEHSGWFGCSRVQERARVEDYARDSWENLYNSVVLFEEVTGAAPVDVSVVGFAFKQTRFEFHADVIRTRPDVTPFNFHYCGINNPPAYVLDRGGARHGEWIALEAFRKSPHGDQGELADKRRRRDPLGRGAYPRKAGTS
jgi:hypothetical protein